MRIALDAMGSDRGPDIMVEGALAALDRTDHDILLVGDRHILEPMLSRRNVRNRRIRVVHATQVVGMHERAKESLKKTDSSIAVAMQLVKAGEADCVVSAGHTGATVAAAIMTWRALPGIRRPAIAWAIPARETPSVLLDVGATVNCKPIHLYQFAVMGAAFAEHVMKTERPCIGLLNIGEEATKGNDVTLETAQMLRRSRLNFGGNAEGRDLVGGQFNVMVCDGFVGNIILKFAEALAEWIITAIKGEVSKNVLAALGALAMKPVLRNFRRRIDYAEYGGAPLLGLNGVCIICHGKSNAKAITNAIRVAGESARLEVNKHILEKLHEGK
ncbi:MAG: phosphate acyltransferase PlsX [Candidatus Sumerlaeia bacterium]|nr:phosphate acyltransferase PlsX [Candidatus Sumerlaeia bacterium]